jgi:hypothetical protein
MCATYTAHLISPPFDRRLIEDKQTYKSEHSVGSQTADPRMREVISASLIVPLICVTGVNSRIGVLFC